MINKFNKYLINLYKYDLININFYYFIFNSHLYLCKFFYEITKTFYIWLFFPKNTKFQKIPKIIFQKNFFFLQKNIKKLINYNDSFFVKIATRICIILNTRRMIFDINFWMFYLYMLIHWSFRTILFLTRHIRAYEMPVYLTGCSSKPFLSIFIV